MVMNQLYELKVRRKSGTIIELEATKNKKL